MITTTVPYMPLRILADSIKGKARDARDLGGDLKYALRRGEITMYQAEEFCLRAGLWPFFGDMQTLSLSIGLPMHRRSARPGKSGITFDMGIWQLSDMAAFLLTARDLGVNVDPKPWVDAVRKTIRDRAFITDSEMICCLDRNRPVDRDFIAVVDKDDEPPVEKVVIRNGREIHWRLVNGVATLSTRKAAIRKAAA